MKHWQPVGLTRERGQNLDRFLFAAEEIVAVLLLHGLETTIRRCVSPQLAWTASAAGCHRRIVPISTFPMLASWRYDPDAVYLQAPADPGRILSPQAAPQSADMSFPALYLSERLVVFGHLHHLPMPASPTRKMNASRSAISCLSCAAHAPPARRLTGAKAPATEDPLRSMAALICSCQRLIRRVIAEKPALRGEPSSAERHLCREPA